MYIAGTVTAMFDSREIPAPAFLACCLHNKEKEIDDGLYTVCVIDL